MTYLWYEVLRNQALGGFTDLRLSRTEFFRTKFLNSVSIFDQNLNEMLLPTT